jgi:hypothetical protein
MQGSFVPTHLIDQWKLVGYNYLYSIQPKKFIATAKTQQQYHNVNPFLSTWSGKKG